MISKDWKLAAVALATVSLLAACAKDDKKKETGVVLAGGTSLTGLWINAEADQELSRFAASGDARVCDVVLSHPTHFGISVSWDGEVSLDAWQISSNGDVYQYTSSARASAMGTSYKERYYMGRVNSAGDFTHRNASLGMALVPPSSRGACYRAPFARGNAEIQDYDGKGIISVHSPISGMRPTIYARVNDKAKLRRLSHALSVCTQLAQIARTCAGYGPVAPVGPQHIAPAPGSYQLPPDAGPQVAVPVPHPGRFQRPRGPQLLQQEEQ